MIRIIAVLGMLLVVPLAASNNETLSYTLAMGGKSLGREAYESELIDKALKRTEERFGRANLSIGRQKLSSLRTWKEIELGRH